MEEILIKKDEYMTPFSRWTLAQSIIPIGISPEKAQSISRELVDELTSKGKKIVDVKDLSKLTKKKLREIDSALPKRYDIWQKYKNGRMSRKIKEPLIVLIGGTTGVGKSTVALEVAYRLGIRNVIGTDFIREILRTMFSEQILPDIHLSTYKAWTAVKIPIAPGEDKTKIGFAEQSKHVLVGIEAVIERARKEGVDIVIEGIHLAPGIIREEILNKPFVCMVILSIESEDVHKLRFSKRSEYSARHAEGYLKEFEQIRKIQNFIIETASERGIPVIRNNKFDEAVEGVLEKVMNNTRELVK